MPLADLINPDYLDISTRLDIASAVTIKPWVKYAILPNFLQRHFIDRIIAHHRSLTFDEISDRRSGTDVLPYDGFVKWADGADVGAELYFDRGWHGYCAGLMGVFLHKPGYTEVKLRRHRRNANGFWIHTDSAERSLVAILYLDRQWLPSDGGLLQLWTLADGLSAPRFDGVGADDRLTMLQDNKLIRTSTPGGGFPDGQEHTLMLLDQVLPAYNTLFLCSFQHGPAYHSISPGANRERTAVVQWLF